MRHQGRGKEENERGKEERKEDKEGGGDATRHSLQLRNAALWSQVWEFLTIQGETSGEGTGTEGWVDGNKH